MQKWEYLFVKADLKNDHDEWRPRSINGNELPNWKAGPTIYDYANQLGNQGWELVSAPITAPTAYVTSYRLIFKRPKP